MTTPSLSILVPCYDEAASVGPLVERLAPVVAELAGRYRVQVLCIDDGSRDGTGDAVRDLARAHRWLGLVSHAHNRGLGAALRTGIRTSDHDLVAMLDADGTYSPADLPRMLARIDEGFDIVIGSPYHPDGKVEGVSALRLLLSRSVSRAYRRVTRSELHCFSGIFKVYRREVLDAVPIESDGFAAVSELLLGALAQGFRAVEVPATLHVRARGRSKMKLLPAVRSHLQLLWRYRDRYRRESGNRSRTRACIDHGTRSHRASSTER